MNITEAVKRACEEPTLSKALTWIAVWETERAVAQAFEWKRTGISTAGHGGGWDTCFERCFEEVLRVFPASPARVVDSEVLGKIQKLLATRI